MRTAISLALFVAACSGTPSEMEKPSNTSNAMAARSTLVGNSPSWATSTNLKSSASSTDWVDVRVYLGWQNADAARALAASVSDPASSSYGKYLTPQQFRALA